MSPGAALETARTLASQGAAGPWPEPCFAPSTFVGALNWGGLGIDVLRGRARLEVSLPSLVALKCLYFLKNVSITRRSTANILGVFHKLHFNIYSEIKISPNSVYPDLLLNV